MNKKVPGKFKDECGGEINSEFCGLRANLYAFKKDGEEEKRCKGQKKPSFQNQSILRITSGACSLEKKNIER